MMRQAAVAGALILGAAPAAADSVILGVAVSAPAEATARLSRWPYRSVTAENAMKWAEIEPQRGVRDHRRADAIMAFAESRGLRVRGHALAWGRLNGPPRWLEAHLQAAADPRAELRRLLRSHVLDLAGRYAGRVAQWDVANEPLALRDGGVDVDDPVFGRLGVEGLADLFAWAHEADPHASLFLNEIGAIGSDRKFAELLALLEALRNLDAPVHGVGLQGHFFSRPPDGALLAARIDALAALGLRVEITELDIPLTLFADASDPLAAQAAAFADVVATCAARPACQGVTVWGVDDGVSWLGPDAAPLPFDAGGDPKPAVAAMLRAAGQPVPEACRAAGERHQRGEAPPRPAHRARQGLKASAQPDPVTSVSRP